MFLKVGDIVDRYVVEDLVAEGGTAAIYRVATRSSARSTRSKVLRVVFDSLRQRTVTEGRIQARIRHPNLVPVTDIISIHRRPGAGHGLRRRSHLEDWLTSGSARSTSSTRSRRGILRGSRLPTSPASCTAT